MVRAVRNSASGILNPTATNAAVGLFEGKRGKTRITPKHGHLKFAKGAEAWLLVYYYRRTKAFDIADLLEFDDDLLDVHPDTSQPFLTLEKGRTARANASHVDAIRIVVPVDSTEFEFDFTVRNDASKRFKNDGPGGTYGRFLLEFFPPDEWLMRGNRVECNTSTFAATTGALLRKP